MATKLFGRTFPLFGACAVLTVPLAWPSVQAPAATDAEGAKLFREKCATCHGEAGKGGPGFKAPLRGTLSVDQLAKFIKASMPPGGPKPSITQSKRIAAYMHAEFYSPIAQARNEPARISLSRLTVKQYRNAVSDLFLGWRQALPDGGKQGLRAEYFAGRERNEKSRLIQRVDPQVKFDFGTGAPGPDGFDARNFQAVWRGSVYAPETGEYEFVVRSDQAVRLEINHAAAPVVDGWVRSDAEREFRGSMYLLGGRAYNLEMEFSKATPGVDDSEKKAKLPVKPAFVELVWKRPKQSEEVIPARFLYSGWTQPVFVPKTPFPADDRSIGYERGNDVNREWDDATTAAALEAASYAAGRINDLADTKDGAPDRMDKIKQYSATIVRRAFRRPLEPEVAKLYVDRQFEGVTDPLVGLKRVVILALKSPRFLYREVGPSTDPYTVAANLSFGLWDTIPDPQLDTAAEKGWINDPKGLRDQAERLARDPRAWPKLRDFYLSWLKVDETPEIVKSAKRFPGFGSAVVADLRTSLELFLEKNGWGPEADYGKLIRSDEQYLNGNLAGLYGADLPKDADFTPVKLDEGDRAGLVTQPYLLARYAYLETSSPIHRGVLLYRGFFGRLLNPPPAAFAPLAASLHPDLTTRERVALQTKNEPCNGCHSLINPVGFTLESFDAIGRKRDRENGKPVNTAGSYRAATGEVTQFKNAIDLANYLVASKEAHASFVEKMFHHLAKQPVRAYGPKTLDVLRSDFEKDGLKIQDLMVEIMVTAARPNSTATGQTQVGKQ